LQRQNKCCWVGWISGWAPEATNRKTKIDQLPMQALAALVPFVCDPLCVQSEEVCPFEETAQTPDSDHWAVPLIIDI
jgi:hypothetical protein